MNKTFISVLTLAILVVACVSTGYFAGLSQKTQTTQTKAQPPEPAAPAQPSQELMELVLKADTAGTGQKIAMATASIDGNIDILFTLDFESGNLFAWLPGPTGFLGEWSTNVGKAIGLEKGSNPDLVLTTGDLNLRGGNSGALRDAPIMVYVANGENGRVAGFGFQWNPQLARAGSFQKGLLLPVYQGSTREQTVKRQ